MSPRVFRNIAACLAIAGTLAFGQSKGTSGPPAGSTGTAGNTGTGIGSTTRGNTTPNLPGNTNPNSPTITTPIFLSGRVAIDDGSSLPEPVAIVRVCNGSPHTEGYTDPSGNFGIQFGNETGVLQDASETGGSGIPGLAPGGMGGGPSGPMGNGQQTMGGMGSSQSASMAMERRLNNCELQARLAGYRSQSVMLAGRQPLDNPDVGTLLLHRITKTEEGNTVSAKSLAAPKDARKAFEKGMEMARKNKVDDAFRDFQKAVMLYPEFAIAWCELGKIEAARGQLDIARGSFNEAVKADQKYVDPYLQLSLLALHEKNWPQLAEFTGKALELDDFDYPQEYLFDAVAHYNMQEFEKAEKSVARAATLDTRHDYPQIAYLKGLVQVQHKEYAAAAESLRTYLKMAPNAEDAGRVRQQLAQIEKYTSQSAAAKQQ